MAEPIYVIPFESPNPGNSVNKPGANGAESKSKPISGTVYPTGPQMPPAYPAASHSLHTWAGDYRRSNGTATGLKDNEFWKRAGADGFKLTIINFITGYIAFQAYVTTKENGSFLELQYSLIVGIAVALNLILSQASVHHLGAPMHAFELWMEHYSTYIHGPFYRIIYWLILVGARLVGYGAAAGFVWGIQVSNAATHAGLPVVNTGISIWWAFFTQVMGSLAIGWTFLHMYQDPSASSDANQSNAPVVVGAVVAVVTYLTLAYTEGGFDFERYIACSVWSGFWPEDGWVYAAGPTAGYAIAAAFWYPIYRETRTNIGEKSD